jgi:glycerol-3-phosphate dehydrogenase (NAD(P)+)
MKLKVLILGYGEMGHALEFLLSAHHDVQIWSRSFRANLEDMVTNAQVIFFCLPVNAHLEMTLRVSPYLNENSLCLSIAKGLDESGMTASQVFSHVLIEKNHYGVIYGPMISEEILLGRVAFADVALTHPSDFTVIRSLFQSSSLSCRQMIDMRGSSWSVILKNVYAIMFGVSDELKLGDNMRSHLMVAALSELSAIVLSLGGEKHTPYGYAGLGDLLTTATSENSHHHKLGRMLAAGIFTEIEGEGIHTLSMVEKYQLFNTQAYPLFNLIQTIVAKPNKLQDHLASYLNQNRTW